MQPPDNYWSDRVYRDYAAALETTERLPRVALTRYRDDLRRQLATFAYRYSPFYKDRLQPLFRNGDDPDLAAWGDIAVLRRADLATQIDRINPAELPPQLGTVTVMRTSGTSGPRMAVRTCALARIAAACMMHRMYRWHGFDLSASLASIRYYSSGRRTFPDGETSRQWSYPGPQSEHFTIDIRHPIDKLADWLCRRRPGYLLTFPSLAEELATQHGADIRAHAAPKAVIAISEIVTNHARERVREAFGCEMAQIYACAEMGCISLQRPGSVESTICEESVFVEILDEDGNEVGPGETGRVVLTSLYNYATPFIRYEIGDYATRSAESGDVLPHARLGRIEGRARNALVDARNRRVWPSAALTRELLDLIPPGRFQIRQSEPTKIELIYCRRADRRSPDRQPIEEYFSRLLQRPIHATLTPADSIPRSSGGKHEAVISTAAGA